MTELRKLCLLNQNQLAGPIPVGLGHLENVEYLFLSGNQVDGVLPSSFANATVTLCPAPVEFGVLADPSLGTVVDPRAYLDC